jgi:hypothetical protein
MRWWNGMSEEWYWCEITDRKEILGEDLYCPKADIAAALKEPLAVAQRKRKIVPSTVSSLRATYGVRTTLELGGPRLILLQPHAQTDQETAFDDKIVQTQYSAHSNEEHRDDQIPEHRSVGWRECETKERRSTR